jgi:outer membrane protein assembly factor BamB
VIEANSKTALNRLWRVLTVVAALPVALPAGEWSQFRGPNASGVSNETGILDDFGPAKNVIWKTALPPGHSSPSIGDDRIFVTGYENKKIWVFCLDRSTGRILWRREVPRPREEALHKSNSPTSPTPATDGKNAFVFLTDFGMMSFGPDGNERWRLPLGPFNNPMGMASSPILAGDTVLQVCDQESGSYFLAVDKNTGKVKWRVERPEFSRGFSTPLLYQPPNGALQVLVTGSYRLTAYEVETGKAVWWVGKLTWQLKPTPVMNKDRIYILGWAGESDTGQQEDIPPFEEVLKKWDTDRDGKLSSSEIPDKKITKDWDAVDLDRTGLLEERDWRLYQSRRASQNAVNAFRLGGQGDMTGENFLWNYTKSLPNVPSPLYYQDVLYILKEGGILTSLNPENGEVWKQARLAGAPGLYFTSPVAADGKIFTISAEGKLSVIKPGREWDVVRVIDLGEETHATPAIAGGRIYVRTHGTLYCFGKTI